MATLKQIVVDCRHPASLARFWAAALDCFEVLPYDDEEIARLAQLGLTPETDPSFLVTSTSQRRIAVSRSTVSSLSERR